jgi:hypothetical protein
VEAPAGLGLAHGTCPMSRWESDEEDVLVTFGGRGIDCERSIPGPAWATAPARCRSITSWPFHIPRYVSQPTERLHIRRRRPYGWREGPLGPADFGSRVRSHTSRGGKGLTGVLGLARVRLAVAAGVLGCLAAGRFGDPSDGGGWPTYESD